MIRQLKFRTRRFDEIFGQRALSTRCSSSAELRAGLFFKCLARYFDVRVSSEKLVKSLRSGERSNAARQNSIRAKSKAPARVSPCYRLNILPDNTYPNADRETRTKNKVSKTFKKSLKS